MRQWYRFTTVMLVCVMVLVCMPRDVQAWAGENWGFESGALDGWTVSSAVDYVGVTAADTYATPYWGSFMAVLGHPGGEGGQPPGQNAIRREFTANVRHLVFAYNIFTYDYLGYDSFTYRISLLENSTVVASWSTTAWGVGTDMKSTGWQLVDIDLSSYLYRDLTIEVSAGGTRDAILPTWAYVDVNDEMPVVRIDMMPEVRFITPAAPGATVPGTSMDVVVEATDDRSIAEVRLLVNGALAGSSMIPGRQTFRVSLWEGTNTLQAVATDGTGKQAMVATTVRADSLGPVVTLDPFPPNKTTAKVLTVSGAVQDAGSGVRRLTIAGAPVAPDLTGAFTTDVLLVRGTNDIVIEAIDNLGNVTSQTFTVTYNVPSSAPSSIYVVLTIGSTNMEVNGLTRTLDAAPFIKDGRTLLPVRALLEALGGSVQWTASTRTALVALGSRTVSLTIGSKTALVNGTPITLDVAPEIKNGRTFLPLRAVAESLGLDLAWEPISRTISLTWWP
jgi:hypothetical protein